MAIKYETPSDGVAVITLNRPEKLNAFDGEQRVELRDAAARASKSSDIRAVVLTGEGRAFCAGADLSSLDEQLMVEDLLNSEYAAFLNILGTMTKPVIAAIKGPAAGIGMTTALTCDLKVMGENSYLMSAFANIGLVPDGGLSWLLTQQIGYARAYEFAIEAKKIDAKSCLDMGLVNRVVTDDDVLANAIEWAASLAERAPVALSLTKRAFRAACMEGLRNAAAYEGMSQRIAMDTDDCKEGVRALFEKRKPVFKGQ